MAWAVIFFDDDASDGNWWSTLCCLLREAVEANGTSVSGVSSTEILLNDMESSLDNVLEETAWDPYPLEDVKLIEMCFYKSSFITQVK